MLLRATALTTAQPDVQHISRRSVLTVTVTAALLAACGGDSAKPPSPASATVAIDTARGSVEIPVRPERVVCVVNYAMHALFSLGFNPIGVPDGFAGVVLPEHAALYAATGKVGPWNQIDLERVAALKPDLILGLEIEWNAPLYDRLTAIAPTVLFPLTGTGDWVQVTEAFAGVVGRASELAALKTRYHERAAAIRSTYAGVLGTARWAIANEFQSGWVLWYPDSSGGQALTEAGVQFAAGAAGKTGNFGQLSYEQIDQLAGADVVLVRANSATTFNASTRALLEQPAFKLLKAATAGHVYPVAGLFPMSYAHALALLDELEAILRKLQAG